MNNLVLYKIGRHFSGYKAVLDLRFSYFTLATFNFTKKDFLYSISNKIQFPLKVGFTIIIRAIKAYKIEDNKI